MDDSFPLRSGAVLWDSRGSLFSIAGQLGARAVRLIFGVRSMIEDAGRGRTLPFFLARGEHKKSGRVAVSATS